MIHSSSPARVTLAPGREGPFVGRHPWVFSGAIKQVSGAPLDGDEVEVVSAGGDFVARGLFNAQSQIRVRLYSWEPGRAIDSSFFTSRLADALSLRRSLGLVEGEGGACRLVFSEGDGLSGLVVDQYADWVVVQFTSLALARRQELILDWLEATLAPRGIYLRTEKGILAEEGLELSDGLVRGADPVEPIPFEEEGTAYLVDLRTGQKTGFFLDQRSNRVRAAAYASGRSVADLFCYTGGFTLPLARAGARSVVGVDSSQPSLALAERNLATNGLGGGRVTLERSDVFRWLDARAIDGTTFGMVVLDPPRFARSARGVPQALKGYETLNELALRCLEPGGILVTCSCTGRVSRDAFVSMLGRVEARSGRPIRVLESLGQASDHPISPTCPETAYLKCLICRVG